MVIDTHVRPALYEPICSDKELFQKRCDSMNYHLMGPSSIELLKKQYALADIQKVFLLASDTMESTIPAISNEDIEKIVSIDKNFFIGFSSVDPGRLNAVEIIEKAFIDLGLTGLYINTATSHLSPKDERIINLLKVCENLKKPVIFHGGLSLENNAFACYSRPLDFEEAVYKFPKINFCFTHVGWPWVQEMAALLLKYDNCYTSTALMNFDGPYQIYRKVFKEDMGELWVEHNLADKIMFGSGTPRIRPVRSKRGLESLGFSQDIQEKIMFKNALRFLNMEEQDR